MGDKGVWKMSSLTEQFVKEIERRILTGEWEIGMKIPSSRELAEEFLVSRSVINAGIAQLCQNGYLRTVPRKYIYVSDWRKMGNYMLLSVLTGNGLFDAQALDDCFEGRMTIEKAIAKKAAVVRTEEDLLQIQSIIEKEKCCTVSKEKADADKEFHHAVAAASHNIIYTALINSFDAVEDRLIQEFYEKEIDYSFVIGMHEKIYEEIKNGNAIEAEKYMEILLEHGENEIKEIRKK